MKLHPFCVAAVFLSFVSSSPAEFREFKDSTGRTIEAELIAVRGKSVELKLKSGKTYTLAIDKFSEDDVAIIKKWGEDNPAPPAPVNVRGLYLDFDKRVDKLSESRSNDDKKKKGGTRKRVETDYTITLKNDSGQDLENVKMSYTLYKHVRDRQLGQGEYSTESLEETDEEEAIDFLAKATTHSLTTISVITTNSEDGGKKGAPKKLHDETLWGVIARVYVNDAEVRAESYPDGVIDRVSAYRAKE